MLSATSLGEIGGREYIDVALRVKKGTPFKYGQLPSKASGISRYTSFLVYIKDIGWKAMVIDFNSITGGMYGDYIQKEGDEDKILFHAKIDGMANEAFRLLDCEQEDRKEG